MELNVSSFYDGEESGKQHNSTAIEQDDNEQTEWKMSPITAEEKRIKSSVFRMQSNHQNIDLKSPLKTMNITDTTTSDNDSAHRPQQSSSSDPKLSMSII